MQIHLILLHFMIQIIIIMIIIMIMSLLEFTQQHTLLHCLVSTPPTTTILSGDGLATKHSLLPLDIARANDHPLSIH